MISKKWRKGVAEHRTERFLGMAVSNDIALDNFNIERFLANRMGSRVNK